MAGYQLKFEGDEITRALDTQLTNPSQRCEDSVYHSGNKQAVSGASVYDFEDNAVTLNSKNFPTHITEMWDPITNKVLSTEEDDHPVWVAVIDLVFEPTVSASGLMEFILQPDNVSPDFVQTVRIDYKAVTSEVEALFAFPLTPQAKADGVKITYSPSSAGEVWDRKILVYRT